jgi:[acyl-carrier-protein] S-malonyltransferase
MQPVAMKLEELLQSIPMEDPNPPVVSNVSAKPVVSKGEVQRLLAQQVTFPVLWEDSIRYMLDQGIDLFVEVGPGKVLKGLLKRIDQKAVCYSVEDMKSLEHLKRQPLV